MKKFLMILLVLAMVFSMAGVVSANDATDGTQASEGTTEGTQMTPMVPLHPADKTDGMDLEYDLVSTYVLKIPSDVSFNTNLEHTGEVSLSNVLLPAKSMLTVTVNSLHDFNLQNGADTDFIVSKIPYFVIKDNGVKVNNSNPWNVVLTVSEGVSENAETLIFKTDGKGATLSGKHTDRLTFNAHWSVNPNAETEITIGSLEQLKKFRDSVNGGNTYEGKTVKLTADIDLKASDENDEPVSFNPIGDSTHPFKGTFDGQGHTIENLYQSGWAFGYDWYHYGSVGLFGKIDGATIKNVVISGAESFVEGGDVGGVVGSATGTCVFEDITITDSDFATYNAGNGGIIGWSDAGDYTFKNIKIGEDVVLAGLWGSFDSSIGGIVGQAEPGATYTFENVDIACRLDVYNDCTASYDYYNYRMCGMIIGRLEETTTIDGTNYPDTSKYNIACSNVEVTYGEWANYHYCEPTPGLNGGRGMRVEAGYAYDGLPADFDHTQCVENHMNPIPFDQIFGGDQLDVKGLKTYDGVTVNYQDECTCDVCLKQQTTS